MVIKEEDILDSSGILAQMDSFKYSYSAGLESWIWLQENHISEI